MLQCVDVNRRDLGVDVGFGCWVLISAKPGSGSGSLCPLVLLHLHHEPFASHNSHAPSKYPSCVVEQHPNSPPVAVRSCVAAGRVWRAAAGWQQGQPAQHVGHEWWASQPVNAPSIRT